MGKPVNKTLRIAAMSAGEEIGHVSGPIVTFRGNGDPLRSLLVAIDPVQAGTGDPSPDNVRPISGWSETNVWRTRKNLLPNTLTTRTVNGTTFTVNEDGSITVRGTPTAQTRVAIKSGLAWDGRFGAYFSCGSMPAGTRVFARRVYNGATTYPTISHQGNFLQGAQYYDIYLEVNTSFDGIPFTIYPQLELGSTATTYEPYSGNTYTIQLGQAVYGGTLDVTNGVLTVDRAMVDLGTLGYSKSSLVQNGFVATSGMPNDFPLAPSSSAIPNWICSNYGNIVSNNAIELESVDYALAWRVSGANKGIIVKDSNYAEYYTNNDMASFKTAMSGVQLVYELATPIAIPLTPQEISTLQGENNVWADSGDVDVEYIATGGEGGKLALLLRNRKELLIALRKGLSPAEVGLLGSIPSFGGSLSPGVIRPGLNTQEEEEDEKDDA